MLTTRIGPSSPNRKSGISSNGSRVNRLTRILLTLFIAFHLAGIIAWALPVNTLLAAAIKESIRPYFLWSGLFQAWDMFSPNPLMLNIYVDAEVTLQNGQKLTWSFPRMEKLSFAQRYSKERYRKWADEGLRMDSNAAMWPDAARYIASRFGTASNRPRAVTLIRHWSNISPPGSEQPEQWQSFAFYTYNVSPGDLP